MKGGSELSSRKLPVLLALAVSTIILVSSLVPSTVATAGQWRLLNPTEYTTFPTSNLNSVFMVNGATSGKGSGNGWAVGQNGLIFFWDGFSWNQATPPTPGCTYDSVNFGGPLNPISNGVQTSSGWTVGQCGGAGGAATSLYWNGVGWQSYPVPAYSGPSEAKSVFLIKSASSATDNVIAIAVGNDAAGGAIWTWNGVPGNGAGWVELSPAPTLNNLNSVYMTQAYLSTCTGPGVQGVAVGASGTILTDCGTWNAVASPVSVNLYGVAMSSPTSGWAVGASCTIIRTTNGLTWAQYTATACTDPTRPLRSIVLLSSSEGWAVGDSDANGHPTILHGTSLDSSPQWTQIPVNQVTPTGLASDVGLNSITFATSGANLWAVGASGVAAFCQNNCSSMSSSIWSTTTSPLTGASLSPTPYQLNSVYMDSDSDGWAVGQANPSGAPVLIQWNGYSWTQAASVLPVVTAPLYGVAMSGSSNAWAVGGASTITTPSTIYFNGNSWSGVAAPSCACILKSVFMISGSETWAVGTNGVIMHSNTQGGTFSSTTSPVPAAANLDTVFFTDSQNGWAGGTCATVTANCLKSGDPIIIHTATDGGDNWGTVFTAGNGLPTASGTSYTITSLFFQDNTHGWAAASSGLANPTLILFWNGVSWTKVSPITTNPDDLFGISVEGGTPATDGWAVGQDSSTHIPVTLHYDGTSWTQMSLTPAIPNTAAFPNGGLLALYLRSSTNGLAVGTGFGANTLAMILHLDPPGSFQNTVVQQTTLTNIVTTSPSATSTTSSTSVTSPSSSTTASTSPPTTIMSTTVPTVTVGNTPTTTTTQATSSVSTPLALPPIPGFPLESILAGILVGIAALTILRRRRK